MINKLKLKNFKAARSLSIELAPLTLLSGLNGSGKSTVLQSLAVLKQSYQARTHNALTLSGPLVFLGQGSDVLSEGAETDTVSISVTSGDNESLWDCKAVRDSSELEFVRAPESLPSFITDQGFQYLQADRIVPDTLYPQAGQQDRLAGFLGGHGEFTADFLQRRAKQDVSAKRLCKEGGIPVQPELLAQVAATEGLLDQVAGWLQHLSPGVHISAESISGLDRVQLQFRYLGGQQGRTGGYRPTNVGFGLTYCLPIITACLSAPTGALLLIENPEAHLHPNGQVMMGRLLRMCASDGVQIIVETHSDHVLNGIRLETKAKKLSPDDVSLNYFKRDLSSGDCYVATPCLLPNGDISNWPEGFFDQWEKSLDALVM